MNIQHWIIGASPDRVRIGKVLNDYQDGRESEELFAHSELGMGVAR